MSSTTPPHSRQVAPGPAPPPKSNVTGTTPFFFDFAKLADGDIELVTVVTNTACMRYQLLGARPPRRQPPPFSASPPPSSSAPVGTLLSAACALVPWRDDAMAGTPGRVLTPAPDAQAPSHLPGGRVPACTSDPPPP